MPALVLALFLFTALNNTYADTFDENFAVVFINEHSEAKYDSLPLDRRLLASAIDKLTQAGARAVVLKFFVDQVKDKEGDLLLAKVLSEIPSVLQARIGHNEDSPNQLAKRFTLTVDANTSIKGDSGWIPAARFSEIAYDICFVDYYGPKIALLETYRGATVKSLLLCSIELAIGEKAVIKPGENAKVGSFTFNLDSLNQVSITAGSEPSKQYIPFHHILENKDWINKVYNKIVIIGYDGPRMHKIKTEAGPVNAHRFFIHVLKNLLSNSQQ